MVWDKSIKSEKYGLKSNEKWKIWPGNKKYGLSDEKSDLALSQF